MNPWIFPAAAALGWFGIQAVGQRLVYPRSRTFRAGPEDTERELEEIFFCAEDGTSLHGWWFPHPDSRGVLLVCHGNAGNVSDRIWIAEDLQDVPLDVFIFDYRGYGRSSGYPSEKGTGRDVLAAYEVVRSRLGNVEDPPVLVYGRSLGGAVALQLAGRVPLRGVILESTFTSTLEIGTRFYPYLLPHLTLRHRYRSDLRIREVQAPVLLAHSPEDETVPYDLGEKLAGLAPRLWRFCPLQGNHVEAGWQTSPEYARAFREFVGEVL